MAWGIMAFLLLSALYLFLISPRFPRKAVWPPRVFQYDYAHRGLYGGEIPENSLAAFDRAATRGYGIELDVQLTRDGELIVMHDATLTRMCGVNKRINEMTVGEIRQYRLAGSSESVPTFAEALDCIKARAPLIIELKGAGKRNGELARKTWERLKDYSGDWIVESFDPRLMGWYRRNAPQAIRGQLAFDPRLGGPQGKGIGYWFLANLLMNCISRPDFVAYCHETDKNFSFRVMRKLFRPVLAAWTVQSKETCQRLRNQYDLQIFEGFEP